MKQSELENLKLRVSPLTKTIYICEGVDDEKQIVLGKKADFGRQVFIAITDRLILSESKSLEYEFGNRKFKLELSWRDVVEIPEGFTERAEKGQIFEQDFDYWEYILGGEDWTGLTHTQKIEKILSRKSETDQ